jgi:hypothetical protein
MQNTSSTQSQNQPNRDDQSKGGEHSHEGDSHDSTKSMNVNVLDQRRQNRPAKETPVKGDQPSRAGGDQ